MLDSSSHFARRNRGVLLRAGFFVDPFGPVNLTILNEGAQRGFLWALLIGFGASAMEDDLLRLFVHRLLLAAGSRLVQAFMQVFSFVFLIFLGVKFLLAQSVNMPTSSAPPRKRSRRASSKNFIRTRPS